MSVPPKDTVAYIGAGRKLTDLWTSTYQARVGAIENCGLQLEFL